MPGARDKNDDHFCIGTQVSQEKLLSDAFDSSYRVFHNQGFMAAVADGMGSYAGGALASRTMLESLAADFQKQTRGDLEARLTAAIKSATKRLQKVLKKEKCKEAGTTLAGVVLQAPDQGIVFHIGDSKVVRFTEGGLRGLTIDHTPVGEDLAFGRTTVEEAVQRRDAFQLTRSLGLIGDTRVEFRPITFSPGDRFLMMTDGVCSPGRGLDAPTMLEFLDSAEEPELILDPMLWEAAERDGDNATLVMVQIDP